MLLIFVICACRDFFLFSCFGIFVCFFDIFHFVRDFFIFSCFGIFVLFFDIFHFVRDFFIFHVLAFLFVF